MLSKKKGRIEAEIYPDGIEWKLRTKQKLTEYEKQIVEMRTKLLETDQLKKKIDELEAKIKECQDILNNILHKLGEKEIKII